MTKRKRRTFTLEFKTEVVLEALRGETSQAELCRRLTSAKSRSQNGSSSSLKLRRLCLPRRISSPARRRVLLTLSSSLGD